MTTPDHLYKTSPKTMFFGTWTSIKTPKPADKEGGIWVYQDLQRCGHDPLLHYKGLPYSYGVCNKPIFEQTWRFVKSGDNVSSLNF